jgi:hypothetical protein
MMHLAAQMARAVVPLVLLTLPASVIWAKPCETPQGTLQSRPASADGSLRTFTGSVTPFGSITGGLMFYPKPDGTFTGQFAFKGQNGSAYGTLEGGFTSATTYIEKLTIKEATGKYGSISGYANFMGTMNTDGTATDRVIEGQVCRS